MTRKKTLRKHTYSIIANVTSKNLNFSDKKKLNIFQMSDKNIDCMYLLEPPWRGDSNDYPQSILF